MGGGKGGSDFNPKGRSDNEVLIPRKMPLLCYNQSALPDYCM